MAEGPATNKMSEAISRALPFLRRYARAVTGSQKRGDEWVRLCAEVAMQQPDLVAQTEDTSSASSRCSTACSSRSAAWKGRAAKTA